MIPTFRVAAAIGGVATVAAVAALVVAGAGSGGAAGADGGAGAAAPVADVGRHDLAATLAVDGVLERTGSRAVYWQQPPPSPATSPSSSSGVAGGGARGGGARAGGGGGSSPSARPAEGPTSVPPPSTSRPPRSSSPPSSTTSSSTSTSTSTSSTTSTTTTTVPPTSTSTSTSSSTTSSSTPCAPGAAGGSTTTSEAPCPTPPVASGVSWTAPAQQPAAPEAEATAAEASGTLTAVAAEGGTVERGRVLFAVDGRPSVLLAGTEPAFRELEAGVDDGADVAQLEENLVALGFAGGDLTVDEHFDADTAAAVEAWQESLGVEPTGRVELGDVVFSPAPATVVATAAAVGDPVAPGDHVLDVAGDTLVATGSVPTRRIDDVGEGRPTLVTLADGSTVSGTVRSVATETVRPEEADVTESTVEVTVQLDATDSAAARAGADAGLAITTATRDGVLAVPVAAIVDGGDGEPAVLVPASSGDGGASSGEARTVPIAPGLSAGGWVEVTGGSLAEGDTVLLPGGESP